MMRVEHRATRAARSVATALVIACGAWVALGTGCGGAASPSAASAPSNASKTSADSPGASPGYPAPYGPGGAGAAPGTYPAPAPTTTASPGTPGGTSRRIEVTVEYDRAARELEAAMSDCSSACRALASLERATVRLCDLAEQADDVQRCEDAKKKLRNARDRVRTSCTSCPGGPSVDRDAPIPSR